jgi:hypothetical protein
MLVEKLGGVVSTAIDSVQEGCGTEVPPVLGPDAVSTDRVVLDDPCSVL